MAVNFTAGKFKADTDAGAPLVGGLLYTHPSGDITTLKATYTSHTLGTPNTNPVVLDARGEAAVWLGSGAYTMVLKTSAGVTIWTQDGIQDTTSQLAFDLASSETGKGAALVAAVGGSGGTAFTTVLGFITRILSSAGSALVGFVQAGTGAVQRTAQEKMRDFVSVKDFGAVGDGVTDDTDAIQAALNASRNVYIPSGTYLFSSLNINYRNTILRGASTRTAILKHTGSGAAITCGDSSSSDPDGRGVYIDSGWFILEDFELMVNGSFGIRVGKTRSTFTQFNRLYIRHRRDLEGGDLNNQYFAGSVAIDCDNTPWVSSYSTYLSKIHHCFIRGFETAVNLQSTVNGWEVNRLYTIECKKQVVLGAVTGISVIDTYFESGVAGAIGFTFLSGGGNNINIIGATFELTNAAATQYAYAFSGGTWESITVIGSKYLIQGDGNSVNNRRTTGTVPATFLEINRSYTSGTYGTIPMMWCPSTSNTVPFQQPNYSRFGGYLQSNGHIKLGRGDTDASDHNIYHGGANTLVFDAHDGGFNFNAKGVASRFVIEPYSAVVRPGADNAQTLGSSTYRWSTIYAATGTINTSDARSKQDDRPLSEKERAVAAKAKELLKAFRFKDAVADKGDEARIHFGVYAQELMAAFEEEGLDPENYAMFCHDKWDAAPEQLDADGNVISHAIEAGDRYGIRYCQLLAFMIAAM